MHAVDDTQRYRRGLKKEREGEEKRVSEADTHRQKKTYLEENFTWLCSVLEVEVVRGVAAGLGGTRGRANRSSSHINVTADSFRSIFLQYIRYMF